MEGGEKDASATTMVTATDTSEMVVAVPIKCQQSNKSPEEEQQYQQMCLRFNQLKEEEAARTTHFKWVSSEQFKGEIQAGDAVKRQNVAPVHPPLALKKQPQHIPVTRHHPQIASKPQHQ